MNILPQWLPQSTAFSHEGFVYATSACAASAKGTVTGEMYQLGSIAALPGTPALGAERKS
jgi:hypothetical protein